MVSKIKDAVLGWYTRGFFRGWQFTLILLIAIVIFVTPERMQAYWSFVARASFALGMVYVVTRVYLAKGEGERTHELTGLRKSLRELAIGIMVCGAFIGAGAGAFG